jgi:hypothetical protein
MSSKVYYVNEIVTAKNIEKLNMELSHFDFKYKYIFFNNICHQNLKNMKIYIPIGIERVIDCSREYNINEDVEDFEIVFKLPFGCICINEFKVRLKKYGNCLVFCVKTDDVFENYKQNEFRIINREENKNNLIYINNKSYIMIH